MESALDLTRAINQLCQFNCNEREARIYLQCLQLGSVTIQELAKSLGFNRVTVHSAVEQLINRGLLFETRKGKRRLVVAEPPSVFARLLQRKENELNVMKQQLEELTTSLSNLYPSDPGLPTVKIYEEADGFKRMLEETLEATGEVLVFTYVDLFSKLIGADYLEDYFQRRADRGIHTRLIFPPCPFANRVNKKRERFNIQIRLLPPAIKWRSGVFAWNNVIAIKSFTQGRITCTIIENEDIAYFWRNVVFELCWKQASPI